MVTTNDLQQLDKTKYLQEPWFKYGKNKPKVREGLASTAFCGCHGQHHKSVVSAFSQIIKKLYFSTESKPAQAMMTCASYDIYVGTFVICHQQNGGPNSKQTFQEMFSASRTWSKPDNTGKDQIALLWYYSVFSDVTNTYMDAFKIMCNIFFFAFGGSCGRCKHILRTKNVFGSHLLTFLM